MGDTGDIRTPFAGACGLPDRVEVAFQVEPWVAYGAPAYGEAHQDEDDTDSNGA